jgi:hypothetical protein
VNKVPSVIQEDPKEWSMSVDGSKNNLMSDKEGDIVSPLKSISLNQKPEKLVTEKSLENTDAGVNMARKGSSLISVGNSRAGHVTEPLLQNVIDMSLSPKRTSVLKPGDINAPFIALNPPILPIIDNDGPSSVYLAPGVSKGPEQQRHANQRIDTETEDPW